MFTCLKRNDKREVKVAQLAGSVGEMSAYHHGEASLMGTIINLAQNFVGSNNINLLQPIGQFGTRWGYSVIYKFLCSVYFNCLRWLQADWICTDSLTLSQALTIRTYFLYWLCLPSFTYNGISKIQVMCFKEKYNLYFYFRLAGGKDAASPRYIFTQMSPLTRLLFNVNDDPLLNYLRDDNQKIEPEW